MLKNILSIFKSQKYIFISKYNYLEIKQRKGNQVLNSKNVNYSFGSLHKVFQKTFKQVNLNLSDSKNVLILGFGAGSIAHILRYDYCWNGKITGVEIDEQVIFLAKKYFKLERINNIDIKIADAEDFVNHTAQKFDLIVIDIFLNLEIPKKFDSSSFIKKVYEILIPGGTMFYNRLAISHTEKERTKKLLKIITNQFSKSGFVEVLKVNRFNQIIVSKK